MLTLRTAIVISLLVSPLSVSASAVPDWMTRPGTIGHATRLEDGSHVYLDAVLVDKIEGKTTPSYLVIRECFSSTDRIVVITPPSPELRLKQIIDVEGDVSTLSNGSRIISNPTIYGYTDKEGNLLRHGPLSKGPFRATPWRWMVDLTVRTRVAAAASMSTAEPIADPAKAPDYYPTVADIIGLQRSQSQRMQTQSLYSGIPEVTGLPDGTPVELQCKRIIGIGVETIDSTEYKYVDIADDLPSEDWIRAYCTADVPVTDRVNLIAGQTRHVGTTPVICVDIGPGYDPQILDGRIQTVGQGTIAYAKSLPNSCSVTICAKIITADRHDLADDHLYVEEPDRNSGILVHYTGWTWMEKDLMVNVTGTTNTLPSGERWIEASTDGISSASTYSDVRPTTMNNAVLGGASFNVLSPGVDTPPGYGTNNIGLLVKAVGRVTGVYQDENCFYVDDGSALNDGNSHSAIGLRVSWDWQNLNTNLEMWAPAVGCFVGVTGISSCESITGGGKIRVLRPRCQWDISYYPPDTTPPDPGTASAPVYTGTSPITVNYVGASDDYSGLNHVELWYKCGTGYWMYYPDDQTGASGSFSFVPPEEGTYYFDLVASDNADNWTDTPSDEDNGDCSTIYDPTLGVINPGGRIMEHIDYLYPGGPLVRTTVFDENGNRFRQVRRNYGPEGELLSLGGDINPVSYTYDTLYRVKTITDGRGNTTNYVYDDDGDPDTYDPPLGLLRRIEYPGGDVVQFPEYDVAGRVLRIIDPSQTVIQFAYSDPEDLPTDILYPATPVLNVHFSYDPVYGRLSQVQDGTGIRSFAYDNSDVPYLETSAYAGLPAQTIQYQYYPNGSLMTMSTPAGDFGYTYDAAGRPVGMTNPFCEAYSWSYLNNDWLQTQVAPASSTTYDYNQRGLVTSITNRKMDQNQTLLSQFIAPSSASGYDPASNLLTMAADIPGLSPLFSGTTNYSYSNLDQLVTEQSTRNGGYSYAFQYDGAGNPTVLRGVAKTYSNAKNQNDLFIYDADGNPRLYNGNSLDYDAENRLTSFGAMSAGYTSDGLRAWKTSDGVTRYYLYSGWIPVCELVPDDGALVISAVNTFGPNGLLARRRLDRAPSTPSICRGTLCSRWTRPPTWSRLSYMMLMVRCSPARPRIRTVFVHGTATIRIPKLVFSC